MLFMHGAIRFELKPIVPLSIGQQRSTESLNRTSHAASAAVSLRGLRLDMLPSWSSIARAVCHPARQWPQDAGVDSTSHRPRLSVTLTGRPPPPLQHPAGAALQVWQPIIDRHMPLRTIRLKHPPSPWLHENEELRERMERRDRAREARDTDRSNTEKQHAFKDSRNAVKKAQHRACMDYLAISHRNYRPKIWSDIRRPIIASKKPEPRAAPLHHSDPAWAERLNRHFVAAGAEVAATLSAAPQGAALSPRPPRVVRDAFKVRTVTLPELSNALRGLGGSRASGEDGVAVQILRATFPVIGPHLHHVINCSLRTGEVPRRWKEACVVPVFKKGDRCDPGNFRPLSINSVPG